MLKKNSLNTNAFYNLLGPIILNGVNFFTIPIFTRMLGTANFGIVSIYTTWVQIFTLIMGIQTAATLSTSRVYYEENEQDAYTSSVLFLSIISSAVITGIILVFIVPVSSFMELDIQIVILMLLHSFGSYVISFMTLKFIYSKKAFGNFLLSISVALLSTVLSLFLIFQIPNSDERYLGRILGYAVPNIIIGLILAVVILINGKTLIKKEYWKFCLPLCLPLIFHGLSQVILSQTDKIMIQKITGSKDLVGIYSFIFTFTHLINVIWNALNNTWVPYYYGHVKNKETDIIKLRSTRYRFVYTILCMGFILVSPEVIKLFAQESFWEGIYLIPIMAIAFYMVFLYSFPVNFEFYHKKTFLIAIGTCCAAFINIGLNALLIPRYEMTGAAVATLISYLLLFVFHHVISKYIIKRDYHYPIKFFIPGIIAVTVTAGIFYLTMDLWLIRWGLGSVLGVLLIYKIWKNKCIF